MKNKEWKKHIAFEALVILTMVLVLTFICRLWPLILLAIVGIIIAALRLLFLSSNKVEVVQPVLALPAPKVEPNETDVRAMAYAVIMNRITLMVTSSYPYARWIWAQPDARRRIENGEDVFILLNRAGGYRNAKVRIENLQVQEIIYSFDATDDTEDVEVIPDDVITEDTNSPGTEEQPPENYELIAYEWVETHIIELNDRCNEAIGEGKSMVILTAEELPDPKSWEAICEELIRAELPDVVCGPEGIIINLAQ